MAAWNAAAGRGFGAPAPTAGFGVAAPAAGFGVAAPAAGFGVAAPAAGFGAPAPAAAGFAAGFGRAAAPAAGFGAPAAAAGFGAPAPAAGFGAAAAPAAGFGRAAAPVAGFGAAAAPAAGFGAPVAAAAGFGAAAAAGPTDHELTQAGTDCISSVVWSPAACPKLMVAATSWDKNFRVWELQAQRSGTLVAQVISQPLTMVAHSAPLLCSALTSDGRAFYGGCCRTAMMLNLGQPGSPPQQVAAHDMPISCMSWIEAGAPAPILATGSWDGKVRFWDLRQQAPVKEESYTVPVTGMDCSQSPLAAFVTARKVSIYNLATMARVGEADPHTSCQFQLRGVSCFKNQTAIVCGTNDGRVSFAPVTAGQTQYSMQFRAHGQDNANKQWVDCYQTNFVAMSSTNGTLITGGSDGHVNFFDVAQKTRFFQTPVKAALGRPIPVSCGALYHDSTMLAYALSYDWSQGKGGYNQSIPAGIFVKCIQATQMR